MSERDSTASACGFGSSPPTKPSQAGGALSGTSAVFSELAQRRSQEPRLTTQAAPQATSNMTSGYDCRVIGKHGSHMTYDYELGLEDRILIQDK